MSAPMSAAEFRCLSEWLGLSQADVAALLEVPEREVRRWMQGPTRGRTNHIPEGVADALKDLEAKTAEAVADLVAHLKDAEESTVLVYRTDADLWAERPEVRPLPARWWRHVVSRARGERDTVGIDYRPPPDHAPTATGDAPPRLPGPSRAHTPPPADPSLQSPS